METPAELKAKELIEKFSETIYSPNNLSHIGGKECALICVDEILKHNPSYAFWQTYDDETPSAVTFFGEVKTAILNYKP